MSDFEPYQVSPRTGNTIIAPATSVLVQPGPYTPAITSASSGPAGKRRKMSKSRTSPTLKRAVSTPQMSSLSASDSGGLSPSTVDKRRNKLGYQRISIACGHCRRRKIRCVISEGDELGRCQNCIRLKKECVFYPVDAAGGTESRAQSKTNLGSKSSSIMSNSPSETNLAHGADREHEFGHFPQLTSNAPPGLTPVDPASGLGISTGSQFLATLITAGRHADSVSDSLSAPEYGYESERQGWSSGIYPPSDVGSADVAAQSPWRLQESPHVENYLGYQTSSEASPAGVYHTYQYPQPRPDYGIHPPPLRSMSFGQIEPEMSTFPHPEAPPSFAFARQGNSPYPVPSLGSAPVPSSTAISDPAITPAVTESGQHFGLYPGQWSYYQQQQSQSSLDYSRHDSVNQWGYPGLQVGVGHSMDEPQHRAQHPMRPPSTIGFTKAHQQTPG